MFNSEIIKNKRMMIAIVTVGIFGSIAFANNNTLEPEEYCEARFSDVKYVMDLRQEYIDSNRENVKETVRAVYQSAYNDAKGMVILNDIVDASFNYSYQFESVNKERVANEFKGNGYVICMAHMTK